MNQNIQQNTQQNKLNNSDINLEQEMDKFNKNLGVINNNTNNQMDNMSIAGSDVGNLVDLSDLDNMI